MARLSFKDVGTTVSDTLYKSSEEQNRIPIGIKTPLEIDHADSSAIFKMHFDLKDQITDNLRNLILTNHGERLGFPDFGANLRPLLTEFSNKDNFDSIAMGRIKNAAGKYMSYVNLVAYESKADRYENEYTGVIKMLILYTVPNLNIQETAMEVTLFVI
jgi:phage baseplate assembly protein W